MLNDYWKHFKSGTDIRAVAMDGVEGEPLDLTDEAVTSMVSAFAVWLSQKSENRANNLWCRSGATALYRARAFAMRRSPNTKLTKRDVWGVFW